MHTKTFFAIALALVGLSSTFLSDSASASCAPPDNPLSNNCDLFNPASASNVIAGGFTDGAFVSNRRLNNISFYSEGITSGFNFTLTNIAYSIDGTNFITTGLSSTSYTIAANGLAGVNLFTTPYTQSSALGNNVKIRYTIPAIPGFAPVDGNGLITVFVQSSNTSVPFNFASQTRSNVAFIFPAPGPLPLFGAVAAFSLSRKVRQRIRQAG